MPTWPSQAEITGEGIKFSAGAGNWVLFDWTTVIGLVTGQLAWSRLRPYAFSIAGRDAVLAKGPLDHKHLPPASAKDIAADKFTLRVGSLPGSIKRIVHSFGYTNAHYIRIDPDASQLLAGDKPRADITADVYVVDAGKARGIRVRFAVTIEPVLRTFLPRTVVDRIMRGRGNSSGAVGVSVGLQGLVVSLRKTVGRGKRKKQIDTSAKWTLGSLLKILLNPGDIRKNPSMLLPDGIAGSLTGATGRGHRYRLEFTGAQREMNIGKAPAGTRIDATVLGLVNTLGTIIPPALAQRARLYVSMSLSLGAAKKLATSLVTGELVQLGEVTLLIAGKTPKQPASAYGISLWVGPGLARLVAGMIPAVRLLMSVYDMGSKILGDPKGVGEALWHLPELLGNIFSGHAGSNLADKVHEVGPAQAALLTMLSQTSVKQKVIAYRAYKRLNGALGGPNRATIMAAASASPDKREQLNRAYAALSDKEVAILRKLSRAANHHGVPMGNASAFDPTALRQSIEHYEQQIAMWQVAFKAGDTLHVARKSGASQDKLKKLASDQARKADKANANRGGGGAKKAPAAVDPDLTMVARKGTAGAARPATDATRAVQANLFSTAAGGSLSAAARARLIETYGWLDQAALADLLANNKVDAGGTTVTLPARDVWFVRELLTQLMRPGKTGKAGKRKAGKATNASVLADYRRRSRRQVGKQTNLGAKAVARAIKRNIRAAKNKDSHLGDFSNHPVDTAEFVRDVVAFQRAHRLRPSGIVDARTLRAYAKADATGTAARGAIDRGDRGAKPVPATRGQHGKPRNKKNSNRSFNPYKRRIISLNNDWLKRSFHVKGDQLELTKQAKLGRVGKDGRVVALGLDHLRTPSTLGNGYSVGLANYKMRAKPMTNMAGAWVVTLRFKLNISRHGKQQRAKFETLRFVFDPQKGVQPLIAFDTRSLARTLVRRGKRVVHKSVGTAAQYGKARVVVTSAKGTVRSNSRTVLVTFSVKVTGGRESYYDPKKRSRVLLEKRRAGVDLVLAIPLSQIRRK